MRFLALPALFLTACVNVVGGPENAAEQASSSGDLPVDVPHAEEPPASPPADEPPADPPPADAPPADAPPPAADPDGDGVVPAGDPGPPPADAGQSCSEWTDCAPHFDDPNSGFDCVNNACTCDDTGQWAQACADIGGSWSSFECFCFTNTDTLMPTAAPETPDQADDDVVCWWSWRLRYCDPDRWVDTSYYERVCDSTGCWNEYVDDGYYEDGQCYGRWIKRCSDGNEYWY
jgi:hypothetical protein